MLSHPNLSLRLFQFSNYIILTQTDFNKVLTNEEKTKRNTVSLNHEDFTISIVSSPEFSCKPVRTFEVYCDVLLKIFPLYWNWNWLLLLRQGNTCLKRPLRHYDLTVFMLQVGQSTLGQGIWDCTKCFNFQRFFCTLTRNFTIPRCIALFNYGAIFILQSDFLLGMSAQTTLKLAFLSINSTLSLYFSCSKISTRLSPNT